MINFPPAFEFSQTNLKDFAACARRFQLRYVLNQPWPAPVAMPLMAQERAAQRGTDFHRAAQRHYLNVPPGALDDTLAGWIESLKTDPPSNLPPERRPEVSVSATLFDRKFVATFDLLAYGSADDPVVIVDWKTESHRPARKVLDSRWQTIVYPVMLIQTAPRLLGFAVRPEQIRMMYWFTVDPGNAEVFDYDSARYKRDQSAIQRQVTAIDDLARSGERVWPLTDDLNQCRVCNYRSLCARPVGAANMDELQQIESGTETVEAAAIPTVQPRDEFVL